MWLENEKYTRSVGLRKLRDYPPARVDGVTECMSGDKEKYTRSVGLRKLRDHPYPPPPPVDGVYAWRMKSTLGLWASENSVTTPPLPPSPAVVVRDGGLTVMKFSYFRP